MANRSQKGFAAIEIILIVIVVALIGGAGYFVWHGRQTPTKNPSDSSKTKKAPTVNSYEECMKLDSSRVLETYPQQCVTKDGQRFTQPIENQYLVVKEWGIKIDVGSAKNADILSYKITGKNNDEDGNALVDTAAVYYNGQLPANSQYCKDPSIILQKSAKRYGDYQTQIGDFWYSIGHNGDCLSVTGIKIEEWKFLAE